MSDYAKQVQDEAALFLECEHYLGKAGQAAREAAARFAETYALDWTAENPRKAAFYREVAKQIREPEQQT